MGITLTDVLLFGKAQSSDVDSAAFAIMRRNILRWGAIGGYVSIVVHGVSPLVLPDAIANSLSYVKAFGGTEQRNIPQPYTQVNYVTNTASTAVDTGIMIDFAKNYEFEVECRAVSGSWYILQSRASASGNVTGIHGETSGSNIKLVVGNVTVCTSAITRTVGNKLYVKATLNAGTATLYVKDETANTEDTQTGSYGTTQPNPTAAVYLLGNAGGQYVDINSDIYMARIKENGVTVMDYVPARQVATAGFYDTVSGTFKTALTPANLSADGNTVPTPDAPMDIVSNNGVLKVRHQSGLPLGYTLLDYITFGGTQYIDTGLAINNNTRVLFDVKRSTSSAQSNYPWLGGVRDYVNNTNINKKTLEFSNKDSTKLYLQYATSGEITLTVPNTTNRHIYDFDKNNLYVDENLIYTATQETFMGNATFLIGTMYSQGSVSTASMFYGDVYEFKLWQDGTNLSMDLIPTKRNSDNVVGMYDLVSEQFFTNAGTGTFTAGDPVSDPVEIYTDGTVETLGMRAGNLVDNSIVGANINVSGEIVSTTGPFITHTAPVIPGETYTCNGLATLAYYTSKPNVGSVSYDNTRTVTTDPTFTVPNDPTIKYVAFRNATADSWVVKGSTKYNGGTATAEMLLKVDNYQDEQEILSGVVTRKVGVKVLDGTENVGTSNTTFTIAISDRVSSKTPLVCSHFEYSTKTSSQVEDLKVISFSSTNIGFRYDACANAAAFKTWLANQYAAGTPVIVVYQLATETTETVTGQPLETTDGDNIAEITQASLDGLELEVEYQAAVSLTIQEVEDANLDNNVTVTIQ